MLAPSGGAAAAADDQGHSSHSSAKRARRMTKKQLKKLRLPEALRFSFSDAEVWALKRTFSYYDVDGSGAIDREELAAVLKNFGQEATDERLDEIFAEADQDGNEEIDFQE